MHTTKIDLECRVERLDGSTVLRVAGEVDLASWKPFGVAIYKAAHDCASLSIDLRDVTHFDACGARALRTVHQLRPQVALTVQNPSRAAEVVLDIAGLSFMTASAQCTCESPCDVLGIAWLGSGLPAIDLRRLELGTHDGAARVVGSSAST